MILRMMVTAFGLGLAAMATACGSTEPASTEPASTEHASPEPASTEPASARYAEVAPALYLGNFTETDCLRLAEERDDAMTSPLTSLDGGRTALAVCARVRDSDEWVVVDGVLSVENVSGRAHVVSIPPDNASALADAPASLDKVAVGHVRLTATFGDMTGVGWIEIDRGPQFP